MNLQIFITDKFKPKTWLQNSQDLAVRVIRGNVSGDVSMIRGKECVFLSGGAELPSRSLYYARRRGVLVYLYG